MLRWGDSVTDSTAAEVMAILGMIFGAIALLCSLVGLVTVWFRG